MNNFFASVECFLNPKLKPYPVAVCGNVEERHGIVLAKNYKAKAFGVRTGEAIWQAKQKCPDLVVVNPHYEEYMKFSKAAREIYGYYTDHVEAFGLDECWQWREDRERDTRADKIRAWADRLNRCVVQQDLREARKRHEEARRGHLHSAREFP